VSSKRLKVLSASTFALAATVLVVVACVPFGSNRIEPASVESTVIATSVDDWSAVLAKVPDSDTDSPVPPTVLDGTYTKFTFKDGSPVPCSYCPEYASELDLWKLHLDKGIFRIFHELTGEWVVGSFAVSGEQITLKNDPHCPGVAGAYTWRLQDGELTFDVVEDNCPTGLRTVNLDGEPWLSCQPPNEEAAITQHWPAPLGCY
jgi:hypothetical protein